jgi:phosphatidylglycerophosphate synthase
MLKIGLRPNFVSLFSMVFAALAGVSMVLAAGAECGWFFWLIAAFCVQGRLFCNLMDGLLAVEGGLKSATGELFNEIPDRIGDALILVPFGYAGGSDWCVALGWSAAVGAVLTAYIRALGASLTGKHDFRGPMAKPHRMAAVTIGSVGLCVLDLLHRGFPMILICLIVINIGVWITCYRRVSSLSKALHNHSPQ